MLYPRMQTVSQKGQMVLPADFRQLFGIGPGSLVLVIPDPTKKQLVVQSVAASDPIIAGLGMFAFEKPLLKVLIVSKQADIKLENKKYGE